MRIGIVLPTNRGREAVFDRVYAAFETTCPDGWEFDITVPEDYATVGEAWNAGAEDVIDSDYVFFTIDDAEPHAGWAEVATRTVDAGYIPAPRQEFSDGSLESCGSMGFGALLPESPDLTPCRNTGIIFARPDWYEQCGPFADRHYSVDDLFCWKASLIGVPVIYRSGMRFTHHHERAAGERIRAEAQSHIRDTLDDMSALRFPDSRRVPAPSDLYLITPSGA